MLDAQQACGAGGLCPCFQPSFTIPGGDLNSLITIGTRLRPDQRFVCQSTKSPDEDRTASKRLSDRKLRIVTAPPSTPRATSRELWLRCGTPSSSHAPGAHISIQLPELGVAAARETFATATVPFAAAWTGLFREMIADCRDLRWRENGPGVGRDARIAYSGLLGRYMARAYLTAYEGVRVLVPLDEAKRVLQGTSYFIRKHPPGQGLEADWIGLDDHGNLVIAEAKGSFDRGVRTWFGPNSPPKVLQTAIAQAQRTAVFRDSQSRPLPAKRWAVASRWANEVNMLDPTLLAWDPDEGKLEDRDYQELARLLHRTDVDSVLKGLGHPQAVHIFENPETVAPVPGELRLRVGRHPLEPGFAALVGPVGIHAVRDRDDLDRVHQLRELNTPAALASLSSRYARTMIRYPFSRDEFPHEDAFKFKFVSDADDRFAQQAGLTVAWPVPGEDIVLASD